MIFKLRPKHHYTWHMAQDLLAGNRVNPRVHSCSDEESFLGKFKRISEKAHGASMCKRVLERYILGMAQFLHQNSSQNR